jgi:hypothetical protein
MYKEKMTLLVTSFSSLIVAVSLLFLPTMIVSRQRLTDNDGACQEAKKLRKAEKKDKKHTTAKKSVDSSDSHLSIVNSVGQQSKKAPVSKGDGIKKETVNEIAVLIYNNVPSQSGSDSKEFEKAPDIVLTQLDLQRPSIDGRKRTSEDLVNDHLMNSEALYFYRMIVPEDAVDKYINSIKEQHHLSDDQLRAMFKEVGYTYEEGRQQLAMGQAIDSLLNFKIRSRLVVLEKDVREYYDSHPVYEEASYRIKKGFIPEDVFTEEELKKVTDKMMENPVIQWSTSYWLMEDEITEERKQMLKAMKQGSYSHVEPATGGYEIIRLMQVKPRALKSFEDRYREISSLLQEPQYYRLLDDLKKELLEKYEVVYFK